MPLVSQTIPNFINGISQQTPTQRGLNQGTKQINMQSKIVEGLCKRPPLEYIATLDNSQVFPNTSYVWEIQRDENNKYFCAFFNGGVRVFDLNGNEKTVSYPNGTSYLTTTTPKEMFRCVNVADFTFVVNRSKTVLADTATSAAKVEEFQIYTKATNFGRTYKVAINHPDMADELEVQFQMPSGNDATTDSEFRDTDKIADILLYGTSSADWNAAASQIGFKVINKASGATVSTTQGLANFSGISSHFTFEKYSSLIYGKPIDGDAGYSVTTSDGAGNTSMYVLRDKVQDFSALPYYAKPDTILQITGDEGDTLTDYYVKFENDGVWAECIAPSTSVGLDNSTMPHALVNNNDGTFTFKQLDYTDRDCGNSTTNPDPSFVNRVIQNVTFYKNRLGFLSGENLILSENTSYFNYFVTTATQVLDTDVIDIAASGTTVNTLRSSVAFNDTLLLFSDNGQYKLDSSGNTAISPLTAILNLVSSFEHNRNVRPVTAGKYAYFAQDRNDNTAIREYYSDEDSLTNDGIDITVGVQDLIPENGYQIISNNIEDTLCVIASDTADSQTAPYTTSSAVTTTHGNRIYVYKYFFDNAEKVQSSWSFWELEGVKILGGLGTDSFIYLFTAEGTNTKLYRIDLRNLKIPSLGFNIYLDKRATVSATYSASTGKSTFTSPYGALTNLLAVNATTGTNLITVNTSGSTYTVEGNHTSLYIGTTFTSTYELSPQFIREESSRGTISITNGRYQIKYITFDFVDTGYFRVEVTPDNRDTLTKQFTGYVIGLPTTLIDRPSISSGALRVPIQAENTKFTLQLKNDSHLPTYIAAADIEGFYHTRSRRG